MSNLTQCPQCGAKIKDSAFSSNFMFSDKQTAFILEFVPDAQNQYCEKCGKDVMIKAKSVYNDELNSINSLIEKNIDKMPIVSTHTPYNWNYEIKGIVTGQTVTGTGIVSEFTSSITDLLGKQSGAFNKKIAEGENMAFAQMRLKALEMGGNAIIATDIDYGELGNLKGMIMVCTTGTAIKLINTDQMKEKSKIIDELINKFERKKYLESIKQSL